MQISKTGIDNIKREEELRLVAYQDVAGVWTIGWGHTGTAKKGMRITEAEATQLLINDLDWAEKAVNQYVTVPLTQSMYDALVSFVFNVGVGGKKGGFKNSTLLKLLNNRDYVGAKDQFKRWNKAGGKVSNGLINRRQREENLFSSEGLDPQNSGSRIPARGSRTPSYSIWSRFIVWLKKLFKGRP